MCLQEFLCHNVATCLVLKLVNWTRRVLQASAQLGARPSGSSGVCPIQHGQISCLILSAHRRLRSSCFIESRKCTRVFVKGSIAKCCCFYRWTCVLTRWGSWVSIPKLLAPDGVVVLNICSATTHLIISRPPPKLLRLKRSRTTIFLVSPQMKLQISLLTLPATKCNKHFLL